MSDSEDSQQYSEEESQEGSEQGSEQGSEEESEEGSEEGSLKEFEVSSHANSEEMKMISLLDSPFGQEGHPFPSRITDTFSSSISKISNDLTQLQTEIQRLYQQSKRTADQTKPLYTYRQEPYQTKPKEFMTQTKYFQKPQQFQQSEPLRFQKPYRRQPGLDQPISLVREKKPPVMSSYRVRNSFFY